MDAARMAFAPLRIMSDGKELQVIEPKNIMRILVIEDEKDVRETIENNLKSLGCAVDAVAFPKEAALLLEDNKYQLIIVDIRFPGPNISGDEFVRKNFDILVNGKVVAFTGFIDDIDPANQRFFDEIVEKGGIGKPLYDYTAKIYEERKQVIAEEMKNGFLKNQREENEKDWLFSKNNLLETLSKKENKDEKTVWFRGRDLSANDIIEEVNDVDSEIGKSYIKMMRDWLKYKKEIK